MNSTIVSIFSIFLLSCASTLPPDKSVLSLNPERAVAMSLSQLEKARSIQADVFSRELYDKGHKFSKQAKECLKKEKFFCAQEKAAISVSYLSKSISLTQNINKSDYKEILNMRQKIIIDKIKRDGVVESKLKTVDENFIETTHRFNRRLNLEEQQLFTEKYKNLRSDILIHDKLSDTYKSLERSRKFEAKEFAPNLYQSALISYERALDAIKNYPNDQSRYSDAVYSAKYNTKLLKDVIEVMYRGDDPEPENRVIAQVFRERSSLIAKELKDKRDSESEEVLSE